MSSSSPRRFQGYKQRYPRWLTGRRGVILSLAIGVLIVIALIAGITRIALTPAQPQASAQPTPPLVVSTITYAPGKGPASSVVPSPTVGVNTALPGFSDWRLAYLNVDGRLHAVSLDGRVDVAGPTLPNLEPPGVSIYGASISPDERYLVYGLPGVTTVNLTSHPQTQIITYPQGVPETIFWSPDSSHAAYNDGGTIYLLDPATWQPIAVSGTASQSVIALERWIDSTHLFVLYNPSLPTPYPAYDALGSLDISTGEIREIITIPVAQKLGVSLAPDGAYALLHGQDSQGQYTILTELLNTTTGSLQLLPTIAQTIGSQYSFLAWNPQATLIAVDGETGIFVLDLTHDRAIPRQQDSIPVGWTPDGSGLIESTSGDSLVYDPNNPQTGLITFTVVNNVISPNPTTVH